MASHTQKVHEKAVRQLRKGKIEELLEKIRNIGVLGKMSVVELSRTLNSLIELGATEEEVKEAFKKADEEYQKIYKSPLVVNPKWGSWRIIREMKEKKKTKNKKRKR